MIGEYATTDITLVQSNGLDIWGTPLAPTNVALKARVEYGTYLVFNSAGENVLCSIKVTMEDRTLTHEDNIIVDGETCIIKKISRPSTLDYQLLEVYLV